MTHLATLTVLILLIVNGVRVTLGIPPVAYWFRSRLCPTCRGAGHIRREEHVEL